MGIKLLLTTLSSMAVFFLFSSFSAHAYTISYDFSGINLGKGTQFFANPGSISLSDSFNQYSESNYEVVFATDDGSGGVNVGYARNESGWDSYDSSIYFTFQVLSDYGNLNPEPVSVNAWGGLYWDWQLDSYLPYGGACCDSELSIENTAHLGFNTGELIYSETDTLTGDYHTIRSGGFNDSFTLFTNTPYWFQYRNAQYVETWTDTPPRHYESWDDYNAFISEFGNSGDAFARSYGSLDYNMVISSVEPVPIPAGVWLFGSGLIGLIGIARRKEA